MKTLKYFLLIIILVAGYSFTGKTVNGNPLEQKNLAKVANATISTRGGTPITSLNDGLIPTGTAGRNQFQGGNRPQRSLGVQWVEYTWNQPVTTGEISVFWWNSDNIFKLPLAYNIKYWNGSDFVPVKNAKGLGLINNQYNITTFDDVQTSRLRLEADSTNWLAMTLLEWLVLKSPDSPDVPPVVNSGADRCVMLGGKTYLAGKIRSVTPVEKAIWTKSSGPGNVTFANKDSLATSATFSATGTYILSLTAKEGSLTSSSPLTVKVMESPSGERLNVVYTKRYSIDSPFWNPRIKAMIVNWIPWCIDQINRTDLKIGPGGIDNFIEAAKALKGQPHGQHKGYVFSNAWVHQTVEAMSIALMIDPKGDKDIIAAQEKMKATLENWIPIILSAQEPDGYLQTAYTLRDPSRWQERWAPRTRGNHEGYVSGYFLESAINHYTLTEGKDKRLYDAAKKLADCWVANIGPGKKEWYDGHQEMEQALVRFGRFVNDMESNHHGDSYIALAKFLLDCRKNGSEYDQSHVPVQQQYEAVGHAVRAAYSYSGMADVAAETGDVDYQSAVMSLWDNMINKKYYITGGIGSGETSEGFGDNYSLPNAAYCEACSSCGLIFFQYKMNIAYHDAKYADLYEETMYNALLGALDLEGKNFYYDNPLVESIIRYPWHVCPCCVGNIPRTLLMIPTWTYVKSKDGIYVNLFIGSSISVEKVAGTNVGMIQKTDYPWSGKVSLTVNPEKASEFSLFIRVPDRTTSSLYKPVPEVKGLKSLTVNGKKIKFNITKGYAEIRRKWSAGDKIDFEFPMEVQSVTPDQNIVATRGTVALKYGPLIFNVEKADQSDIEKYIGTGPLKAVWRPDILGGVMTITGKWDDGSDLTAIPNYARCNRVTNPDGKTPVSLVWIKKKV